MSGSTDQEQENEQKDTDGGIHNLEELLDRIIDSASNGQITLDDIMGMIGRRSFGPLLLIAGILILAPIIGDIPGVPTIIALFVFLIAVQLLFGRQYFWLPQWLLRRSVSGDKLKKGLKYLYKPARFIDRFLKARLLMFVNGYSRYAVAAVSIAIALAMPVMEIVPFSANAAGIVLVGFGLSLIARDGLLTLISFVLAIGTYALIMLGIL